MIDLQSLVPEAGRSKLRPRPQPDWVSPMLATLTERRFSDPGWMFERKLDGERCLGFRRGPTTRLLSRNRLSAGESYPEVVEALARQSVADFIVDGEVVAFEGNQTSFARLQQRMKLHDPHGRRRTGVAVFYYVFDVLYAGGYETTSLPLRDRKALLRRILSFHDLLRFTVHRNAEGEAFWREACRKGWEGVIAKRADAPYEHRRSPNWLKFKCVNEQEFVIGGYTEPKGSRKGFGALLIGHYDGDRLRYAGKVGTGFNDELLADLSRQLASLEQDHPPFAGDGLPRKGVHWVQPLLVCQVGFTEWTRDGQLRHPRFQGLRRDKSPHDVVRERPAR
jgi:bifunctional non-homologous end joining protein LigD